MEMVRCCQRGGLWFLWWGAGRFSCDAAGKAAGTGAGWLPAVQIGNNFRLEESVKAYRAMEKCSAGGKIMELV